MLLAILLSLGSVVLLVVMGKISDELLGDQAERWARRRHRSQKPRR